MKQQQDFQSIFRDRQRSLSERPSPQTWRRLERRLDFHARRHHQAGLRRGMGLAAGIFALIVFIGLMTLHFGGEYLRMQDKNRQGSFQLETVRLNEDDERTLQLLEYNRAHSADARAIPEGQPGKEIVVRGM